MATAAAYLMALLLGSALIGALTLIAFALYRLGKWADGGYWRR